MANVHGLNDFNNNRPGRNNAAREPMLGQGDYSPQISQHIRQNKIPFMNSLASDRPPLDETIPYTLKLVWCPTLTLLSFTSFLLIAVWALYITTLIFGIDTNSKTHAVLAPLSSTLEKFGAIKASLIKNGQVWRLITAAFLHADLLHITMNSISILFFLSRLQKCYNLKLITIVAFASALSGNITSAIFLPENSISVGASTIIFGIFGGLLAYMTINWNNLGRIRSQLCCIVGIIIFISVIMSFGGTTDLAGHLGGMAGGYACSIAIFPAIKPKNKIFTIAGSATFAAYIIIMFLIFFLR